MNRAEFRASLEEAPSSGTISLTQLVGDASAGLLRKRVPGIDSSLVAPFLVDSEALSISGTLSLAGRSLRTDVYATAGSQGDDLSAVTVTVTLDSWQTTVEGSTVSIESAGTYLSSPRLSVTVEGDAPPVAMLRGDLALPGVSGRHELVAPLGRDEEGFSVVFDGEVDIPLESLDHLASLVDGMHVEVPSEIPTLTSLKVSGASVAVDPVIDTVTSLTLRISSDTAVDVIEDVLTLESFAVAVRMLFPPSADCYVTLSALARLGGYGVDVGVSLPDLFFTGGLRHDTPVPLEPIVAPLLGGHRIPDAATISALSIGFGLTAPHDWAVEVDLASPFSFPLPPGSSTDLEQLAISMRGQGTTCHDLTVVARLELGGTGIYVEAQDAGGEWTFSGGTVGEQPVALGDVLAELEQLVALDAATVPDELHSLTLDSLNVEIDADGFELWFTVRVPVAGAELQTTLFVASETSSGGGDLTISWTAALATESAYLQVTADVQSGPDGLRIVATESAPAGSVRLSELLSALGADVEIPGGLDPSLDELGVFYDGGGSGAAGTLVVELTVGEYGSLLVAALDEAPDGESGDVYVVGVVPDITVSLSSLPVVGAELAGKVDVTVGPVQVLVASRPLSQDETTRLTEGLNALDLVTRWSLPDPAQGSSGELRTTIDVAGEQHEVVVPLGGTRPKSLADRGATAAGVSTSSSPQASTSPASGSAGMRWVTVGKSIGPLSLNRLGAAAPDGEVELAIDASLALGPVALALDGLSVLLPLDTLQPRFGLAGMSLGVDAGEVRASGAFRSTSPEAVGGDDWEYAGAVSISTPAFTLRGMGSYGRSGNEATLFVFFVVDAPIGGPPFFFVTGLAAGFGYNRSIVVPAADALPRFPLVAAATAQSPAQSPFAGKRDDPSAALEVMEEYLPAAVGDDWLAAGVRFTSFKMVDSFALLTISFGTRTEIRLMGQSAATIPAPAPRESVPVVAKIVVDFLVHVDPAAGQLAMDAVLAPGSFLLREDARLSGGMAFYVWFPPSDHEGDFVLSVGGYHPRFAPPAHYPRVGRLALNWQVSSLVVKGELYFALTPSVVMAGGALHATWQSGDVSAWFDAQADFLIRFKPFHYAIDVSVSIGVSYTVHLLLTTKQVTAHVGATLHLWGPPFGGEAYVDLPVIPFTIGFGASAPSPPADLEWTQFRPSFLPPANETERQSSHKPVLGAATRTDSLITISAPSGLLDDGARTSSGWLVDPAQLQLVVGTQVPSKTATFASKAAQVPAGSWNREFGIGPMGAAPADVAVDLDVKLTRDDAADDSDWSVAAVTRSVPSGLWLHTSNQMQSDGRVKDVLMGLSLVPSPARPDQTLPVPVARLLSEDTAVVDFAWSGATVPTTRFDAARPMEELSRALVDEDVAARRASLLSDLAAAGVQTTATVDVAAFAADASNLLGRAPELRPLGVTPAVAAA